MEVHQTRQRGQRDLVVLCHRVYERFQPVCLCTAKSLALCVCAYIISKMLNILCASNIYRPMTSRKYQIKSAHFRFIVVSIWVILIDFLAVCRSYDTHEPELWHFGRGLCWASATAFHIFESFEQSFKSKIVKFCEIKKSIVIYENF